MYLLGILIFLGLLSYVAMFTTTINVYIDFPSILLILALSIPILMASGLLPDFLRGFKLMGQKSNTHSALELNRMLIANKLAMTLFLLSGVLGSVMGSIAILSNNIDKTIIGPSFAVAVLTSLYAIVLTIILLPIQAKIKVILTTLE